MSKVSEQEFSQTIIGAYEKHMLEAGLKEQQIALIHLKVAADLIGLLAR